MNTALAPFTGPVNGPFLNANAIRSNDNLLVAALNASVPVSVMSPLFGAKGDGVTDDTGPLNAALATPGRLVYLPAATYYINGNLAKPLCAGIIGESDLASIIQCGPGVTKLLPLGNACTVHANYQIKGNAIGLTQGIVYGDTEAGAYVIGNVRVYGFTGAGATGVQFKNALKSQITRMTIQRCATNLLIDGTGGLGGFPTTLTFDELVCIDAGLGGGGAIGQGCKIITADMVVFNEPVFDSCVAEALIVQPGANGTVTEVVLWNPRFEDNNQGPTTYQMVADGSAAGSTARVSVRGGTWSQGTKTSKSIQFTGPGVAGFVLDNPNVSNVAGAVNIANGAYGQGPNWPRNLPYATVVVDTARSAATPTLGMQTPVAPWLAYTPAYTSDLGNQATTFSGAITTTVAKFQIIEKLCYVSLSWSGTLNAVTPAWVGVSLPTGLLTQGSTTSIQCVVKNTMSDVGTAQYGGDNTLHFFRKDAALFSAGAAVGGMLSAVIEIQ